MLNCINHKNNKMENQTEFESGRKAGMVQGIALALSLTLRCENPQGIWTSAGMSLKECIANNVDAFDMEKLIPEFAKKEDAEEVAQYHNVNFSSHTKNAEAFLDYMTSLYGKLSECTDGEGERDVEAEMDEAREKYIKELKVN